MKGLRETPCQEARRASLYLMVAGEMKDTALETKDVAALVAHLRFICYPSALLCSKVTLQMTVFELTYPVGF